MLFFIFIFVSVLLVAQQVAEDVADEAIEAPEGRPLWFWIYCLAVVIGVSVFGYFWIPRSKLMRSFEIGKEKTDDKHHLYLKKKIKKGHQTQVQKAT